MYARADEECSFFFFFFSYHVFASHSNTLLYFARSRLAVAAADNALANENGRFTADVYNPTRWRSLCSILRDKSNENTLRLVAKCIFLFTYFITIIKD